MTLENQAILSNYEQLTALDAAGKVWLVKDVTTSKIFVKKHIICESLEIYTRLQAAKVPGIPEICHVFEEDDGSAIVIEEYIHGEDLEKIRKSRTFSHEEIADIGLQLCAILSKIHAMEPPIICRDIKPSNIVQSGDKYYLVDFNIAREYEPNQTQDTHLLGTFTYASPEQYGFAQTNACTDIYSLGVTMNVLATKCAPQEKLAQGELGVIIAKATEMEPASRYQSAQELAKALKSTMQNNPRKSKNQTFGFKKSLLFAVPFYALWGWFSIYCFNSSMPNNGWFDLWSMRLSVFFLAFIPYLYNANFFGLCDKTLGSYSKGSFRYWLFRVLYTFLFTLIVISTLFFLDVASANI